MLTKLYTKYLLILLFKTNPFFFGLNQEKIICHYNKKIKAFFFKRKSKYILNIVLGSFLNIFIFKTNVYNNNNDTLAKIKLK